MLATIPDDTWNVLNMQHIIPNSKRWYYSDIPVCGHKVIKGIHCLQSYDLQNIIQIIKGNRNFSSYMSKFVVNLVATDGLITWSYKDIWLHSDDQVWLGIFWGPTLEGWTSDAI